MKKMELKFTPRTVKELEQRAKMPYLDYLGEFGMASITLWAEKGWNVEEKVAENRLEKYLAEDDNDIFTFYTEIVDSLKKGGLLPRTMDTDFIKEKLKNFGKKQKKMMKQLEEEK